MHFPHFPHFHPTHGMHELPASEFGNLLLILLGLLVTLLFYPWHAL